jgi:hypothetical protein
MLGFQPKLVGGSTTEAERARRYLRASQIIDRDFCLVEKCDKEVQFIRFVAIAILDSIPNNQVAICACISGLMILNKCASTITANSR